MLPLIPDEDKNFNGSIVLDFLNHLPLAPEADPDIELMRRGGKAWGLTLPAFLPSAILYYRKEGRGSGPPYPRSATEYCSKSHREYFQFPRPGRGKLG